MTHIQVTLDKKPVQSEKEEKPWKGVCCKRCWYAKSDKKKCRCRCHGANHQEGFRRNIEGSKKLDVVVE
jgi:hypothetical protein